MGNLLTKEQLFVAACTSGDRNRVGKLIRDKFDVNIKGLGGITGLHMACRNGYIEIVRELIQNKAEIDIRDDDDQTPLMTACSQGHDKVVKILLENDTNVNAKNKNGVTALMAACFKGNSTIVTDLLQRHAQINEKDKDDQTALMGACYEGHENLVKILLESNADVNLAAKNGVTTLMAACRKGNAIIVNDLLKNNAQIDAVDKNNQTALMAACSEGHENVVSILVDQNANVNVENRNGATSLMAACLRGNSTIANYLLQHHANVDAKDKDGQTALMLACHEGHEKVVKVLLEHNANVNIATKKNVTALMFASTHGYGAIVNDLLQSNAQIDAKNLAGDTAMMSACREGHVDIAKILLDSNASVDIENRRGYTSLMLASFYGHIEVVRLLLDHKADVNIRGNRGETALFLALIKEHYDIEKILREYGAEEGNFRRRSSDINSSTSDDNDFMLPGSSAAQNLKGATGSFHDESTEAQLRSLASILSDSLKSMNQLIQPFVRGMKHEISSRELKILITPTTPVNFNLKNAKNVAMGNIYIQHQKDDDDDLQESNAESTGDGVKQTTDATDTSLPNIEHGQSASSEKSIPSRDQQGDHDTHGGSDDESAEEIIVETTDATDTSLPNIEHGQSASSEKSIPSRNQQGEHDTHGGSADESAGEIIVEKPDEETFVKTKMEKEISVDEITQVKNVSDQRKPHPFKVWNRDRTLKKAVLGSSLHALIQIDLEIQEIKVDDLYLYRDSEVLAKIIFFPTGQFQSIEENPKRPTRPFKVWNSDRTKKYAVMASSLQTLIQKGQEKLREVENPRVVLEEDGTLVDEEDYFCTLPDDSIVQLLGEGEIWRSCKTDVPVEKTDSASSAALENQEVTVDELCRDLKEDLARIITFSTEQLQDLVDADAPSLARKLEESERFVKKLQSACQRFLDERADAMETADLVRLYDEASKANKVDKAVHTTD